MGSMTLVNFRDELLFNLKNRNDTGLTTARLNRWINQSYLHMTRPRVMKHSELLGRLDVGLITGQDEYDIGFVNVGYKLLGVRDVIYYDGAAGPTVTRRNLSPRSIHWINKRVKPSGAPQAYALEGVAGNATLSINTVPTTTENGNELRVWHYREASVLVADGDTTVLSDYWDTVLVLGSQFFAEWFLGYRDLAVATGQVYQNMINETLDDLELNAEDTDHQTEIVSESYMQLPSGSGF